MPRARTAKTLTRLLSAAAICSSSSAVATFSASGQIERVGHIDPSIGQNLTSDVTGWVDPSDGTEYAILGEWIGGKVFIIDVSDPANPDIASTIFNVTGLDLKTWDHYLYVVDGDGNGIDGRIYDIEDPELPQPVGNFVSAHNIFIDARGIMYNEVAGLTILDVASSPTSPVALFSVGTDGHDATVVGNSLYDFHGPTGTNIYDVADPSAPQLLGSISGFNITYHHSGWPSTDGNYLFLTDELAPSLRADISVFDISNPMTPVRVDTFRDPSAIVHNAYVLGDFLYVSYYTAGFRVFDVSDPSNMQLVDEYDTSPFDGETFSGAWGCYPYTPSGNIYVSDIETGLHIFRFAPVGTSAPEPRLVHATLGPCFPNPLQLSTTIPFELMADGPVEVTIHNALGERVRTLVDGFARLGSQSATWDGRDENARRVASGVYFYRLVAGARAHTRPVVVLH